MDVEVILNGGELKVIEIDARLPSQTPITVYWSTGLNMLSLLKNIFVDSHMPAESSKLSNLPAWLEHIKISGDELLISGEHMISHAGPLTIQPNFFGAEEAITDYRPDSNNWVATIIHTAATPNQLISKRAQTIENIRRQLGLLHVVDSSPGILIPSRVEDRAGILRRQKNPAPTALSHGSCVGEGERSAVCPPDRQLAKSCDLFGGLSLSLALNFNATPYKSR